jgi:hypothetical protein
MTIAIDNTSSSPRALPTTQKKEQPTIPPLDQTNKAIFEALTSLELPDADQYRRICNNDIPDAGRTLEFRPHDTRLNVVRARLIDSTFCLNNLGDTTAELPLAWIEMGRSKPQLTRTLIDSGARGNFKSEAFARRRQFTATPTTIKVRVADNRSVPAAGTTTVSISLGNENIDVTFVVLADCAYDAILGTKFFYKYSACIDFEERNIRLAIMRDSRKIHVRIPFIPTHIPLLASQDVTIAAGTIATVPVTPDPTFFNAHECLHLEERNRWGIASSVHGANANPTIANLNIATGIIRLVGNATDASDNDTYNWVSAMNATDTATIIKRGDVIATFRQEDFEHTSITHLNTLETGPTPPTELPQSEVELDAAIASHAYLKDLSLINDTNHLDNLQTMALKRLVLKYHRLWDPAPKPVSPNVPACDIRLREGAEFNHQGTVIPMNPPTRDQLRALIQHKLKRDIIEPSTSPSSSTILLVPKPNGGVRFVIDYRELNKAVAPDAYTLPAVDESLASLNGNRYFTSLDMKEAFWTVPLNKRSRELTAFRTPDGLFMYKRLPMGLKTASAVFCRFIDRVLGDLKWDSVLAYIDDLLIATPTFKKHLTVLETVFARLDAANITLGAAKCYLAQPKVHFLGHVESADGILPNPDKVLAIEALTLPNDKPSLETALGIMGYYRKFIYNYAAIAEPLRLKLAGPPHTWRKGTDGMISWSEDE